MNLKMTKFIVYLSIIYINSSYAGLFSALSAQDYAKATQSIQNNDWIKFNEIISSKGDDPEQYGCLLNDVIAFMGYTGKCYEDYVSLLLKKKHQFISEKSKIILVNVKVEGISQLMKLVV